MGAGPPMQRRSRDDEALARVYGKRAALGLCGVVAVWFSAASVAQLVPAVFSARIKPLVAGRPGSPEQVCADGLRAPARGLPGEISTDAAQDPVARACGETPAGLDAWAALERLRTAEEQLNGSDPAAVAELRRELAAHLPAEMR